MSVNCFELTGIIVKSPKLTVSPAGISHCQFSLEHRSIQIEADMNKQAYVRIQVLASGQWTQQLTQNLTVGTEVKVSGFLNRHEQTNGLGQLVLHAQQVEKLN